MPIVHKYQTYFISSDPRAGALNVSPTGDIFQILLDRPITIPRNAIDAQIRVLDSNIWNVVPNISASIGNNVLNFNIQGTSYTTNFPDGLYSLEALEEFIQRDLELKGLDPTAIQFSGNGATQKSVLRFGVDNVQIDFTQANSPREILGFDSRLVPLTPQPAGFSEEGDSQANFNRTEYFLISTDLISNGVPLNSTSGNGVIHKALIQAPPGSQSNFLPYKPIVVDASELIGFSKNQFTVRLTDQLNRPVSTQGESFSFTMELSYSIESNVKSLAHEAQGTRWS